MADKNYEIKEDYQYDPEIRALQDNDRATATETFNPLIEKIINNTHAVKNSVDEHKESQDHDDRYYTQDQIENKLSALETNIDWKESVDTFSDIAVKYPNPDDGWTVNVKDTDYTYRWTGMEWVAISANSIPIATKDVDGKMSKEQVGKLEGISNNANNYTHPNSGASAGTYRSVTVDTQGHVTAGSNPTVTVAQGGTGATDAAGARTNLGVPPTSHASTATTYGTSSDTNYGHAIASGTSPKAAGTAAVGTETAKFARGDHVHPVQTTVSGNAGTATKLQTPRAIALSGAVTGTATNFDGSGNITIPTTGLNVGNANAGTLAVGRGGTGATDAAGARTNLGVPPISHASTGTGYGVSSDTNYGHAIASGTSPKAAGTAALGTETAKFARGDHVHPVQTTVSGNAGTATKLQTPRSIALSGAVTGTATNFDGSGNITIPTTALNVGNANAGTLAVGRGGTGATDVAGARTNLGVPPTGHASAANTYGIGTSSNYGHVKLTDSTSSTSGQDAGIAASANAVRGLANRISALESGGGGREDIYLTTFSQEMKAGTYESVINQMVESNSIQEGFRVNANKDAVACLYAGDIELSGFVRFDSQGGECILKIGGIHQFRVVFGGDGIWTTAVIPTLRYKVSPNDTIQVFVSGIIPNGMEGRFYYRYVSRR